MPKKLLFSLFIFFYAGVFYCGERYWVGGGGNWNDTRHWSVNSGGKAGAAVPTLHDDVVIDDNSFLSLGETVAIKGLAQCHSLKCSKSETYPELYGDSYSELYISGSFFLDASINYKFAGTLHFISSNKGNRINFDSKTVLGNVVFQGTGSWILDNNLLLEKNKKIRFFSGEIISNGKNIQCASLDISGEASKKLVLDNSILILDSGERLIKKGSFNLRANNSRIHVNHPASLAQMREGDKKSNNVIDSVQYTAVIPTCNNSFEGPSKDGSILVTSVFPAGPGPFGFEWSGGTLAGATFGNPITGLGGGVYLLTVTDSSDGSQFQTFITVTPPPPIGLTFTKKKPTCFGECNGWITVNPIGGTPAYAYSWSNLQTAQTATGLCLNPFISIQLTDINGCNKTFSTSLTQPNLLSVSTGVTDILCNGQCNGIVTANPLGGTTTNYTYSWSPGGQVTKSISALCVGTYTVTVKDDSLCVATATTTVAQPKVLSATILKADATCNASCNGSATANPFGGSPNYTYVWLPGGQTTQTINGLCSGNYTVNITDANGCKTSAVVSITQPNFLRVTASSTALKCSGDCDAIASSSIVGGTAPYTYSWSIGGEVTPSISGLCAGIYTVNITDANNCKAVASVTVTQPPLLNVGLTVSNPSCSSKCDGKLTTVPAGGSSPYLYAWSPGGETTAVISNLCVGSYTVTVTDAKGCTNFAEVSISEPISISVNVAATDVSCSGGCDGILISNPSGGIGMFSYLWAPGGQTTQTVSGLCAGVYAVTVTDANGCKATQNATVTQPALLVAAITQSTSSCVICNGTATVSPSGGIPPYNYLWSPSGQTTPTATSLCVSSYSVSVTDAKGCVARNVVKILQVVNITVTSSSSNLSCFGACDGAASANASGGTLPYVYDWQAGGQTTQSVTGLCVGLYTVTVTDANGCFNSSPVTFANPPLLTTTASKTDVLCNGTCSGTATANPAGGTGAYAYLWSPGGQSTQTATGLCAGSYTVSINDVNGCSVNTTVTITQPSPTVTDNAVVANSDCNQSNGSITLAPTGGVSPYTYLWAPGGQITPAVSNIPAGVYTVNITDQNGCRYTFAITVNDKNGPVLTSSVTPASCYGTCNGTGAVAVSGGSGPFNYLWIPGGQIIASNSNLCNGTYNVRVSDVATGCIKIASLTVTEPSAFSANAIKVNATCNSICDGRISISATGGTPGYNYLWSPGGSASSSLSNLCAGSYSVTISDSRGCDTLLAFSITQPLPLNIAMTFTNVPCNSDCKGAVSATVSGGTPTYLYSWAPGGQLIQSIANICAGTYTLSVTDGNSCPVQRTVTITEPVALTSSIVSQNIACKNTCSGSAKIIGSGGTLPFSYLWTPGSMTTDTVDNLCGGAYSVTITDANGCVSIQSVTITEPASALTFTATATSPSCSNYCNGTANANPSGGAIPYQFLWSNLLVTQSVLNMCSGSYSVTVTDAKGCVAGQVVTISDPPMLFSNASPTSPSCVGGCNGVVVANPVGGLPTYSYSWLPGGETSQAVSGLCAGTYTVITTDQNGCQDSQLVAVNNPSVFSIATSFAPANCGVCNGSLSAIPSGGNPPYTYLWQPGGLTTQAITGICAGTYTVTITDNNACDSTLVIALNNSGGPTSEIIVTSDIPCNGMCIGSGTVTPIGGTAPYNYLWNDALIQATQSATGLCGGPYLVRVTDALGCIHFSPITISEPNAISFNPVLIQNSCTGICNGSISLSASGGTSGYAYNWLPGGQSVSSINNICSGTYSVTITDSRGCNSSASYSINPIMTLAATISKTDVACNTVCNGSAKVSVTSGSPPFTFQWSDPLGQNDSVAVGLCAGTYSVIIRNGIGCSLVQTVSISSLPVVSAVPSVTNSQCNVCDGLVSLAPSGGTGPYTYLWGNGQTSSIVSNLCAGVHAVRITDSQGCSVNSNISVSNIGAPSVNINNNNISCFGLCNGSATLVPSGGTSPYSYLWVQSGQTGSSYSGLCAGTYDVQVSDALGCIATTTVMITSPQQILDNRVLINPVCGVCNGSISLNPSGGIAPYSYSWLGGQIASSLTALCPGTYSVTIADNRGCLQSYQIPVSNVGGPTVAINTSFQNCSNSCSGMAGVTIIGGAGPFTYSWSNGFITPTVSGLCAGDYNVKVTDGNGCSKVVVFNMTTNNPVDFSIPSLSQISCAANCNGIATVIPSGGAPPYIYQWMPGGQTGSSASSLCAGTYTIIVTDASACSAAQSIIMTAPPAFALDTSMTSSSCSTIMDGSIDFIVNGGSPPYTYLWSPGGQSTQDLNGVLTGWYKVVVSDVRGCKDSLDVFVNTNSIVNSNAGSDDTICVGSSILLDGRLSAGATSYSWYQLPNLSSTIATTSTVSVAPPGSISISYLLVVSNGICSDADTVVISLSQPFANAGIDASIITGGSANLGGNPTGPAGATYIWSPAEGLNNPSVSNPNANPTVTTSYTVMVTDVQGCTARDVVVVTLLPQIIVPNGISPNGDGSNDKWIIDFIELFPNCVVEVYNRWGELLFQSPGYVEKWDGNFKGKPLPVGTYYYIINLNHPLFPEPNTGPITILR